MESNGGNLKESLISRILAIFYGFNLIVETFVHAIFTTAIFIYKNKFLNFIEFHCFANLQNSANFDTFSQ